MTGNNTTRTAEIAVSLVVNVLFDDVIISLWFIKPI